MTDNPLARLLAGVGFFAVLVLSLMLGAVALMVILGLGLILATVTMLRVWWISRRLRKRMGPQGEGDAGSGTRREVYIIEGEFRRDDEEEPRR